MTPPAAPTGRPVRFGLVGVGRWGRKLAPHLVRQGHVVGVCSTGGQQGRDWAAHHLPSDLALTTSIEELLALRPDAVVVASPRSTHARFAEAVLASGCHALVEKPLAAHAAQAFELARSADERDVVLQVDYTHLYDTAFEALCRRAHDVDDLRLHWQVPGRPQLDDVLFELFPHVVAMAVSFDAATQVHRAVATPSHDRMCIAVELRGPRGRFEAQVTVGPVERAKRLVAQGLDPARSWVWTDRLLEEQVGLDVIESHRAVEEPLHRVVAGFVAAIEARRRHDPTPPSWPPAAVARAPQLLDDLIALVGDPTEGSLTDA